jgi:hypothetical protein
MITRRVLMKTNNQHMKTITSSPGLNKVRPVYYLLLFTLSFMTCFESVAQVAYNWTPTTGGTYTQLSGGGITVINANAGLSAGLTNNQDDGAALVTLPFTFTYMGNPFTEVTFCTNGWIGMGNQMSITSLNSRVGGNLFTATAPVNTIGVWFKDMGANFPITQPGTGPGSMRHGLTGTDIYTFQWDQAVGSSFSITTANLIRFQVSIHGPASATPGRIELLYGTTTGTITATGAAIGIENATGGTNNYINALNGLQNSTTTSSAWPGNGNGWRFDPQAPCVIPADQPTALTLTPVSTSQIDGSFTPAGSTPNGYLVVRYPNGAATTNPVNGTTYIAGQSLGLGTVVSFGAATSFSTTGLTGSTTYDYYVYAYNNLLCSGAPAYNTTINAGQNSGSASTNACGVIASPITVGPTGTYPTLSGPGGAIAAIATTGISSPLVIEMQSTYTGAGETYPITMSYDACITATNTVTIRPEVSATSAILITSNHATSTIDMNGASFITIDGRPGGSGTDKFLTIENTGTTGQSVLLRNESSNNTLTYLDVRAANANGANNTTTALAGSTIPGAIAIGTTTGANGNDNNTISFCDVHSITSGGNLGVCIYAYNSTAAGTASNNDNNSIINNNIYDFFLGALASAGINVTPGNNNYSITNNRIYQTASLTFTGTQTVRGMWISPNTGSLTSASGYVISNNTIGYSTSAATGTYTMTGTTGWLFSGMDLSLGIGTASSVQNNTITNFNVTSGNTGSTAFVGINVANGVVDIGTVTGNLIGSNTVNGAITFTATANTGGVLGIRTGGGSLINIANNQVSGVDLLSSVLTVAPVFNGIAVSGGTTVNVTNNTVGSLTLANSINAISASTSTSIQSIRGITVNSGATARVVTGNIIANMNTNIVAIGTQATTMQGIQVTAGTVTVSNNTITNLSSSTQTTSGGNTSAIVGIAYSSTTAPATISGNTIHTLRLTSPTATGATTCQAITFTGPTTGTNVIEKNNIHSLSLANTASTLGVLSGMDVGSGLVTIKNNMIRLGLDENGNSVTAGILIRGISSNSTTQNIYNNSIYIGGTGVASSTINSTCFQKTGAVIADVRNNIFMNDRSNAAGTAKHYAVNLNNTTSLTLNYNDYYGTGTGYVFGFNGTTDFATYSSGWVASDINSQAGNPEFINPAGTAATGDLHIHPTNQTFIEQNGTNIASVTDDFDGQSRAAFTPDDIGADAGNFAGFFCSGPPASATATLTVPAQVCGNVTKTINLSGFTALPGYTYQWQESATGLPGSFVNVTGGTGANAISYTTAILNASMYYQCEIGCSFGAGTTTSSSVFADILPAPVLAVTPTSGTSVCSGANVDLSASGANTYTWTVNPGVAGYPVVSLLTTRNNLANVTSRPTSTLASSTATPPATVATPTWTYTVTGTALNGCTSQAVVVLNVITSPVVPVQLTYTYLPDPVCATGTPVTFTVNNPGTVGAGSWVYNWYDQSGTTLLQSTTTTSATDNYTPSTPSSNGNYIYQVRASNTVCPASYAVASPSFFVGYTSLNVVSDANCGDNGVATVYPEGQNSFTTWYSNNFATGLQGPAFDASFGNTNFTGGRANITNQANSQTGALIIRNNAAINTNNLQVDFKMSTGPRGFAFNILGADGMCWSYGGDVTVGTVTTGGQGEGGSGTGLKLAFDATANGPNNLPGCYLMFNCTVVGQGPGDPGVLAYKLGSWWQGLVDAPVAIIISQNGFVTVTVNNEVIFDHIQLPASYLTSNKSNWIHSFTARTGGSNELHAIDDLNIRYNSYEYSNNSTTGLDGTWQTSNTFSGLAAGTYPLWVRNPVDPTCVSNVGNAVIGTSPSPSSAITVAAPGFNTTICAGSSTDLTTDVSIPGAIFLWETASSLGGPYSPASGVNNTAIYSTGALLASAYYRCTFTCPSSSPVTSTPVLVTVNSGTITSTNSPQQVNCLNSIATVTANPGPNTTIVWYASPSGGSPLFSGNSYSVTPSSFPSTYYAEPVTTTFTNHYDLGGEKSVGGNLNGGTAAGVNISSKFNTTASIRIDSIKVLPNAAGTLTVALQNAGSATNISSFNQTILAAQVGTFVNVPVNFVVTGSGNYQLTTSGVTCSYNPTYPPANYGLSYMNLGGVFSIVGGSTTPTGATSTSVYGTSYNWSITTSCPTGGARVPVVVDINPASLVTVNPSSSTFCVGGFAQLVASSPTVYSDYGWSPVTNLFIDSLGTIPYTAGTNEDTVYAISAAGGSITYTASTAVTGCTNTATAVVTGNPSPIITATTTTPVLCNGDTAQISVNITSPVSVNYSVTSIPHAPLDPTGSSDWGAGPSGDDSQVATTLPFPFTYFGTAYTNVSIYSNGFIQFGTSSNSTTVYGANIPSAANPNNIVALAWEDFNVVSPDSIRFYTVGAAPNRQWVAEWVNVDFFTTGGNVSGQIVLNEADNTIDIYHTNIDNNGNQTACGVENSNGTAGFTPPSRNFSLWTPNPVVNEAWKFTPLPATNISWSGANIIGSSTEANIQANPPSSGYFTVTVTNPLNGCTRADSVLISSSVNPKPVITDNDTTLCNPDFIYVNVVDTGALCRRISCRY